MLTSNEMINLFKIPIPETMKLLDREFNPVYITNLNEQNYMFYNRCFSYTFDELNKLKALSFLTISKKGQERIKKATEELHKMFKETTKYVLQDDNNYKLFNLTKEEWKRAQNSMRYNENNYLYGRMDIGISFDLDHIKIFEYNTGLCGDIFDMTDYQKHIFNYYLIQNKNKYSLGNLTNIENSPFSGDNFLDILGNRWKELLIKNKIYKQLPVYFITANDNEEHLTLSSHLKALEKNNIYYKVCKYAKGLKFDINSPYLIDREFDSPVKFLYKTYSWYKIFDALKKDKEKTSFLQIFRPGKFKYNYIEPIWKTVMGSKALLPFVYKRYPNSEYLLPTSFNPFDSIFEDDEYLIEKGFKGRGSQQTKKVRKKDLDKYNLKKNVIYQKIFDKNKYFDNHYIMGAFTVGPKFGGIWIKESDTIVNKYFCNVIPVKFLNI